MDQLIHNRLIAPDMAFENSWFLYIASDILTLLSAQGQLPTNQSVNARHCNDAVGLQSIEGIGVFCRVGVTAPAARIFEKIKV